VCLLFLFFFSSRRRHTRCLSDWSSDVCSSDLGGPQAGKQAAVSLRAPVRIRQASEASGQGGAALVSLSLLSLRPSLERHRAGARSEERRVGKEGRCGWWGEREMRKSRRGSSMN